ncbi:MAG TPA: TolC family protein [Bryobacteraceae bacterium]|nr:TolC family protein [Bryobacteraceae bacterium]
MLLRIYLCAAVTAFSQSSPALSLSDAVSEARRNHPEIALANARLRGAEARRIQAGLRPNPQLTLQTENARFWGRPAFSFSQDTDNFAYLTWSFEAGGKRGMRVEEAEAGIAAAHAERERAERSIASRVVIAYWNAVAAQGLRDLVGQVAGNFREVVDYHRTRVAEGAMAEVDLMRVLLEQDRLAVSASGAEAQVQSTRIALLREIGRADMHVPVLADSLVEAAEILRPNLAAVLETRPDLIAARRIIAQARAQLRLQEAQWQPDPQALFGYKRSNGFNTIIAGLQIDLPFSNRNQGEVAAAAADITAAEASVRAAEAAARAEIEGAWQTYEARRRLLRETLGPMRNRAEEIARIALAAYREGGLDLLRLLDAQRARLEAMTAWYQALADYRISVATVQVVTGAPL